MQQYATMSQWYDWLLKSQVWKGYFGCVDETFAESEVIVWEVGQSFQQNLSSHRALEIIRVELIPVKEIKQWQMWQILPGPRLNIKTIFPRYGDS